MRKLLFFLMFASVHYCGFTQKVYGIVKLTVPFSGISYTNGHNRMEFRPSVARINGSWGIDLIYKIKKLYHKVSVEQVPFEQNFKLINKFRMPPHVDTLLGFKEASFGTAIDHFIFNYALQKEGKRAKGFLFHSKIRFNYSMGVGLSLNRSKSFYETGGNYISGGFASPSTYVAYEAKIHRNGFGVFLRGTGGFDFVTIKGKRKLCFNVFYNHGLKQMAHYDIHYQYGYFNDPSKQVDVTKQVLRSRGTTFGFSLGVPIRIKK